MILRHGFLRHGFYLLLKSCKEQIQEILNSLDEDGKIKYILNDEVLDKEKNVNKILKEQTYFFEFLDEITKIYSDEDEQMYMRELFSRITKAEYAGIFINSTKHKIYEIFNHEYYTKYRNVFGEIYISLIVGNLTHLMKKSS